MRGWMMTDKTFMMIMITNFSFLPVQRIAQSPLNV